MYYNRACGSNFSKCPMMENKQCPMMDANNNQSMQQKHSNEEGNQLEMYYPEIYFKIYPSIKNHCDNIENKYGNNQCPSKHEIDIIIEEISIMIEKDLDGEDKKDCGEKKKRQYGRGRLVRDLVGIMLLNELIGRRRPSYPYYGGYYNYWY